MEISGLTELINHVAGGRETGNQFGVVYVYYGLLQ